jgi:hypothetical protein
MSRARSFTAVTTLVVVAAVTATAWASLTGHGSGSGSGTAVVGLQSVTIAATTGTTQTLLPTGSATGDIRATITNPNTSRVHLTSLSLDTSQATSGFSANASACALGLTTQTNGGNGWTIPASSQITVDLTSSLTMGTAAANTCQGQTFTVYLKTP